MISLAQRTLDLSVSILAPLARGALPKFISAGAVIRVFQSSPPSQGGRYDVSGAIRKRRHGFNPRPPRKGGAT